MSALGKKYHLGEVLRVSNWGDYGATEAKEFIKILKEVLAQTSQPF